MRLAVEQQWLEVCLCLNTPMQLLSEYTDRASLLEQHLILKQLWRGFVRFVEQYQYLQLKYFRFRVLVLHNQPLI